jgi:hypothetical protein
MAQPGQPHLCRPRSNRHPAAPRHSRHQHPTSRADTSKSATRTAAPVASHTTSSSSEPAPCRCVHGWTGSTARRRRRSPPAALNGRSFALTTSLNDMDAKTALIVGHQHVRTRRPGIPKGVASAAGASVTRFGGWPGVRYSRTEGRPPVHARDVRGVSEPTGVWSGAELRSLADSGPWMPPASNDSVLTGTIGRVSAAATHCRDRRLRRDAPAAGRSSGGHGAVAKINGRERG